MVAQLLGRAAGPRQHPGVRTTTVPHPVHCRHVHVTVPASRRGPENSRHGCAGDPSHPFTLRLGGQCLGTDAKGEQRYGRSQGPPCCSGPHRAFWRVLAGSLPSRAPTAALYPDPHTAGPNSQPLTPNPLGAETRVRTVRHHPGAKVKEEPSD